MPAASKAKISNGSPVELDDSDRTEFQIAREGGEFAVSLIVAAEPAGWVVCCIANVS